jgi:hypothetical protein
LRQTNDKLIAGLYSGLKVLFELILFDLTLMDRFLKLFVFFVFLIVAIKGYEIGVADKEQKLMENVFFRI